MTSKEKFARFTLEELQEALERLDEEREELREVIRVNNSVELLEGVMRIYCEKGNLRDEIFHECVLREYTRK